VPSLAIHQRTKIIEFWHQEKSITKVQWCYCYKFWSSSSVWASKVNNRRVWNSYCWECLWQVWKSQWMEANRSIFDKHWNC